MTYDLLIRDVRVRDGSGPTDIAIKGDRIVALGPGLDADAASVVDGGGGLALPGFVNGHIHLDKVYLPDALRPPRFESYKRHLEISRAQRAGYTLEDITARAERAIEEAIENGTSALRAFADVEPVVGTMTVQALVGLREKYRDQLLIQITAFPQEGLYSIPDGERLLEEALDAGADLVGGLPEFERTEERMRRHIDFCLALAKRRQLDLHIAIDASDSPTKQMLHYLAIRTIEEGWEGRVTAGNVGALAAYDHTYAEEVIGLVCDAGIACSVAPHTALVQYGRHDRGLIRRGTTRCRELLAAGVNVIAVQDDLDNPWYTLGRGDQLEVAQFTAHVEQLAWPEELETVIDMVTERAAKALRLPDYGLLPGKRADLVVLPVPTVREAIRLMPPRRYVVFGGRIVAEAIVERLRHQQSVGAIG